MQKATAYTRGILFTTQFTSTNRPKHYAVLKSVEYTEQHNIMLFYRATKPQIYKND